MRRLNSNPLPYCALTALLAAGPAWAQAPAAPAATPTPEGAKALQQELATRLRAALGSVTKLPPEPVQVTAAGDHYDVSVPIGTFGRIKPEDAAVTAKLRPLGGTRWAVDGERLPPEFTISTTEKVAVPAEGGKTAPTTRTEPVTFRVKLGTQAITGTTDTAFASPSSISGTIDSLDVEKEGGSAASLTHVNSISLQSNATPVDPARVTLIYDVDAAGYATKTSMPGIATGQITADHLHVGVSAVALAHEQLAPLNRLINEYVHLPEPKGDAPPITAAQQAKLHALLEAARGLLTGGKLVESAQGVRFDVSGTTGHIDRAEIGVQADAPGGTLTASLPIVLNGLTIDGLPPQMAAYVPGRLEIRPTVGNLGVAALTRLGLDATAPATPGKPMPPPDLGPLFANGGITFGFDGLALDLAGAQLTGSGTFTAAAPTARSITGTAQLAARGLDALVTQAQADPLLQQGLPVLIFLKGIAKADGDRSIWQVTVGGGKALVNGVDLAAMAGAMK